MKILKKILKGILEPITLTNKNIAEKLTKFFNKYQIAIYVLALLISLVACYITYYDFFNN